MQILPAILDDVETSLYFLLAGQYDHLSYYNIACSEINDRGGIKGKKVEVIYEDSQNDPKKAVNAFNKLISSIC